MVGWASGLVLAHDLSIGCWTLLAEAIDMLQAMNTGHDKGDAVSGSPIS